MTHNDKPTDKKSGINPIAAAVTGAVVGASLVAGAVVLGNKKNRDKAKQMLSKAQTHAKEYMGDMQAQSKINKSMIEDKLAKANQKINHSVSSAQKYVAQEINDLKKAVKS